MELKQQIAGDFKFSHTSEDEFGLCHAYIREHKIDSRAEIMEARHGFFRGLTLALLPAAIGFVAVAALQKGHGPIGYVKVEKLPHASLAIAVALVLGTAVSVYRYSQFNRYFVEEVYTSYAMHHLAK